MSCDYNIVVVLHGSGQLSAWVLIIVDIFASSSILFTGSKMTTLPPLRNAALRPVEAQKMVQMNLFTKQKQSQITNCNKFMVTKGEKER